MSPKTEEHPDSERQAQELNLECTRTKGIRSAGAIRRRTCVRVGGLTGLLVMLAFLAPQAAVACGAIGDILVVPGSGATSVPLNAEPLMDPTRLAISAITLCAVDAQGMLSPQPSTSERLEARITRLVPSDLLQPRTRYVLSAATDCSGLQVGTFTTGTETDLTPPDFPGVVAVVEDFFKSDPHAPCGSPPDHAFYRLELPQPVDPEAGTSNLVLVVYEGPTPETVDLETPSMVLESWNRELAGKLSPDVRDSLSVVITALDWAGNESAPQEPVVAQQRACGCRGGGEGVFALALLLLPSLLRRRGVAADRMRPGA